MELPDSISDMDSIPERLALSRKYGVDSLVAKVIASREDMGARHLPTMTHAALTTTKAIKELGAVIIAGEVAELERMYRD